MLDHEIETVEEGADVAKNYGLHKLAKSLSDIAKRAREHREKDAEQRRMEELSARLNWGEVIG